MLKPALIAAFVLAGGSAQAHVSVSPTVAKSGGYQVFRFGVGHACAGSAATTAVRLEIPEGVTLANPQAKSAWKMTIEPGADAKGAPRAIVWKGRLPGDQFDEFVVMMKLPNRIGAMPITAIQTCDKGETRWADKAPSATPAPTVTLTASGAAEPMTGTAGMEGMDHGKH